MNRIANALELSKQSWGALRKNPQLLMFPIISMIGMIIVSVLFFIPIAGAGILDAATSSRGISQQQGILTTVVLFIYYVIAYTIVIFSNTALVGAAMKLVRGEPATVSDGIQIASARLGKIFVYALISATIGMIARGIRDSGRNSNNLAATIITAIIGSLIQGAWNVVVFFAIPVLVAEDIGVVDSIKRSFDLFKRTWGEGFVGSTTIGGISCLLTLAALIIGGVVIFAAVSTGSVAVIITAIVLVVLALVLIGLLSGAVNGIFQASLYQYATTGDAGQFIDTELARTAFAAR